MSPEELDELRKSAEMVQCIGIQNAAVCRHPYNGVNNASFALVNLPDLLAHIDSQAAQIAALTEKLVESEARRMYPFTVPMWDNLPDEDFTKRTFGGMEDRHGKAFFRLKARQQLKAEMPEVKWDA